MTLLDSGPPSAGSSDAFDESARILLNGSHDRHLHGDVDDVAAGRGPAWLDAWLKVHCTDLVYWRRLLHANPEVGYREYATTSLIADTLAGAGLTPRILSRGTGLVCDIGSGERCVALRADLDALPLQESTGLPYGSKVAGVAHACGHDAHTAMLLAAGLALASAPALPGRIRLIFQPAEELQPGGAFDVLAANALDGVERIFALHCDPRLQVGQIGTRMGSITSAADMLELRLTSPGGHTSRPHLTADLVHALGSVITGLPALLSRRLDPRSGTVLVWGAVHAGEAPNAVPQLGMLRGTLRTGDRETWAELEPLVRDLINALLVPTGVGYELHHQRGVPPVVNDRASTRMLRAATIAAIGEDALAQAEHSSGGDDFGWYVEHVPGSYARLGVWPGRGPKRDLHQGSFDLDERALPIGVRVLTQTALTALA